MPKKSGMQKNRYGEEKRHAEEIRWRVSGKPVDRASLQFLKELGSAMEETTGPGSVADLGCGPIADMSAAGVVVMARTDREPCPGRELESRRCYLLCQRS